MSRIRALVVDDSAIMRRLVSAALNSDPDIEVVGAAADPLEARAAIKALAPDVLTLDVEMPHMSGLEFLEKLMRLHPMPVVMVSSLTHKGAEAAIEALALGAVDCVGKPVNATAGDSFQDLAAKVKAAARARVGQRAAAPSASVGADYRSNGMILGVGASTGGVEALLTFLSSFPVNCPPTVITQHMPASFTRSFADRLNRECRPTVQEAFEGAPLLPGHVYVAPGGTHHLSIAGSGIYRCRLGDEGAVNGHRPSVDVLFGSLSRVAGVAAVGVILTGMGRDGAEGLLAMRDAGGRTFGQDEASSVIYGMPKAAFELGAVERQAPLARLASLALEACRQQRSAA
jgi:two-component system chemotaxis response regulator CheB